MNQIPISSNANINTNTTNNNITNDVLGCVYRFILEHVYDKTNTSLKPLTSAQIIRGWQHMAIAPRFDEYCVITAISQTKHGTPIHNYCPQKESDNGTLGMQYLLIHSIQIDFFCNPKVPSDNRAYERAFIVEALANSTECASIFESYNELISCLYSSDITNFCEIDETHQMRCRYSITLTLSEVKTHTAPQRFVDYLPIQKYKIN